MFLQSRLKGFAEGREALFSAWCVVLCKGLLAMAPRDRQLDIGGSSVSVFITARSTICSPCQSSISCTLPPVGPGPAVAHPVACELQVLPAHGQEARTQGHEGRRLVSRSRRQAAASCRQADTHLHLTVQTLKRGSTNLWQHEGVDGAEEVRGADS